MSRRATIVAALEAADLAEESGDYHRAAELLAQVERDAKGDGRRFAAVQAYTSVLYEPRNRVRA